MKRRHSPIGIETAYLQPLRLNFTGKIAHQPHQVLHGKPYHKDSEQIGNIFHYTQEDTLYRIPYIREQLVGEVFCLREYGEEQWHRQHQLKQHHRISQQICQEDKQIHLLLRIQQFVILNGDRFQFGIFQSLDTHFQLIEQPGGEFKQQILAYDYKNEIENAFAKLPQAMLVFHHL